jgi:hypothetical protein
MSVEETKAMKVALRLMGNRCEDCEYWAHFDLLSVQSFGFCKGLVVPPKGQRCCKGFVRREDPE